MLRRYFRTKKLYNEAFKISEDKGKKLMVIGDPCHGNYFAWMSRFFPNCEHGDVTIDLNGCSRCNQMNINDMDAWSQFD
ncbi:MAG: hypothetical protein ACJZ33_03000, partial [Candidatus Poseidoniales archaeon]